MSLAERVLLGLSRPEARLSWDLDDPVTGPELLAEVEVVADALTGALAGGSTASALSGPTVLTQLPGSRVAAVLHLACLASGVPVVSVPVTTDAAAVASVVGRARPRLAVTLHEEAAAVVRREGSGEGVVLSQNDLGDPARLVALLARLAPPRHEELVRRCRDVDDRAPALLLPTSGTTGPSKLVVHNQRSLEAAVDLTAFRAGVTRQDVFFSPSPPTHITGLFFGLYLPLLHGGGTAFQSRWDPDVALEIVARHGCTVCSAVPTFALDLHYAWRRAGGPFLRLYMVGGADVPTDAIRSIEEETGCVFVRGYGGTEAPMMTMGRPEDPQERRLGADGSVLVPGQVRVKGDEGGATGAAGSTGAPGELLVRGPQAAMGVLSEAAGSTGSAESTGTTWSVEPLASEDGWLSLGDEGTVVDGVVTVTGRLKDVIVRGGVKFYVPELDGVVGSLPGVRDAAVFAVPDARLGQLPAAAVVREDGATGPLTAATVSQALSARDVAPQKHPVDVMEVEAIPRTPTGKVDRPSLAARYEKEFSK